MYFSPFGDTIIVLLMGGDKSSQLSDIKKVVKLWEDYHHEIERFLQDF
ncbi:hypothetical protein [Cyanobacterium aponinum]|nr:hypothetical protein [Cyanobacterium aponinum]